MFIGNSCNRVSEAENLRALGIKAPIAVIPHGIDLPPDLPARHLMHRFPSENTSCFFANSPQEGLLELVEACARLKDKNWKVIIAGTDWTAIKLLSKEPFNTAQLQDRFSFVGPVYGEHKDAMFAKADVLYCQPIAKTSGCDCRGVGPWGACHHDDGRAMGRAEYR